MTQVRTSLEIGFAADGLPPRYAGLRGRVWRAIPVGTEIPFEDAQFEVVLMHASAVTHALIKETNRVLKPDGRLYFTVPEKTGSQAGFTVPEIYSLVRDGFHLVEVHRRPWWAFGRPRELSICAKKKYWKTLTNTYRPYV